MGKPSQGLGLAVAVLLTLSGTVWHAAASSDEDVNQALPLAQELLDTTVSTASQVISTNQVTVQTGAEAAHQHQTAVQTPVLDSVAQEHLPGNHAASVDAFGHQQHDIAASQHSQGGVSSDEGGLTADASQGSVQGVDGAERPAPDVRPVNPFAVKYNATAKILQHAYLELFGSETRRNISAGVRKLQLLASVLDEVVPPEVRIRRKLADELQAPQADPSSSTETEHTEVASAAEGGEGAQAADAAAAPSVWADEEQPQHIQYEKYQGTGVQVAASAAFTLTALRHAGIVPSTTPGDSSTAALLQQLHQQAQAGGTEALLALADRYFTGAGVEQSCTLGARYARLGALAVSHEVEREGRYAQYFAPADLRSRHVDAQYVSAEEVEDAAHVVHMEEDMAIRGNQDAQRRMAYRRLVGRGIEADPEGAFLDFQAGAAQGDPYAIFNLGFMYVRGLHVAQDFGQAQRLFMQAAEKGFAPAWNGLGVMAWSGQGGPVNMSHAVELFRRGAAMNQSDSLYNLALMHVHGTADLPVNLTAAAELFIRADEEGHWRAALDVAGMFEEGRGLPQDCGKAERYYRKFMQERTNWARAMSLAHKAAQEGDDWAAMVVYLVMAEQGSAHAAANAAWLLRQGRGYAGPGFLDLAADMYERAALQNHTTAAIDLGYMLLEADQLNLVHHATNASAAVEWWDHAAQHNSSEALFLLGWAHHMGVGVSEVNTTLARQLYQRSIQAAGKARTRAVAGYLGVLTLDLDRLLEPLLGPSAATRCLIWLRYQVFGDEWVTPGAAYPASPASGAARLAAGSLGGEPPVPAWDPRMQQQQQLSGSGLRVLLQRLQQLQDPRQWVALGAALRNQAVQQAKAVQEAWVAAGVTSADVENAAVTLLLGALAAVLLLRRRLQHQAARASRQQAGVPVVGPGRDEAERQLRQLLRPQAQEGGEAGSDASEADMQAGSVAAPVIGGHQAADWHSNTCAGTLKEEVWRESGEPGAGLGLEEAQGTDHRQAVGSAASSSGSFTRGTAAGGDAHLDGGH